MIAQIAAALSDELGITVYYGFIPDAESGNLDELVAIRGFALNRPQHDFGEDLPVMTTLGVAVHARLGTQEDAEELCTDAYETLLSMGYIALAPPVSLGKQQGRFEVVAQVEAHQIRTEDVS